MCISSTYLCMHLYPLQIWSVRADSDVCRLHSDMLVASAAGSEHEVLAGTGTQQPGAATGQAAGDGGSAARQSLRLSAEQQKQLAEAEKRAAKATRKAEKEVGTAGWLTFA
jgi:hypothetical protein